MPKKKATRGPLVLRHTGPLPQPVRIDFDRFRIARERASLTQNELARRANVSQRRVSETERGALPNVRLATAAAWAEACGVSLDWLCGLSDDMRPRGPAR